MTAADLPLIEAAAALFEAGSDPARLVILGLLGDGPLMARDLFRAFYQVDPSAASPTPPTLSDHMTRLRDMGLVAATFDPTSASNRYTITETGRLLLVAAGLAATGAGR